MPSQRQDSIPVRVLRVRDRRFLCEVNSGMVVEIDADTWTEIARAARSNGIRQEMLATIRDRTFGPPLPPPTFDRSTPGLSAVVLQISNACNLRCRYCSAGFGGYGQRHRRMTKEIAREAVDFLFDHREADRVAVNFFGGEPLLNWDVMRSAAEYARARGAAEGVEVELHLVTNGLGLSPDVVADLERLQVTFTVSLDGPAQVQDRYRPRVNGTGSYSGVAAGLRRLADAGLADRTTVRGTFVRPTAYFAPLVFDIVEAGFSRSISYEPAFLPIGDPLALRWKDLPAVKRGYRDVAQYYVRRVREGRPFCFWDFDHAILELCRRSPRRDHCGAGRRLLAVTGEGALYACHMSTGVAGAYLGSIGAGIDRARQEPWRRDLPEGKRACETCWLYANCAGGCSNHATVYNQHPDQPYRLECAFIEARYRMSMWILGECPDLACAVRDWAAAAMPLLDGHVTVPVWWILEQTCRRGREGSP